MENLKISRMEFESLAQGFCVSESEGWNDVSPEEYSHIFAVATYPEAFSDGVRLKKKVNMVISADSNSDYINDVAAYDRTVNELNDKYGRVAVLSTELKTPSDGYGIIGYRFSPWASITTVEFTGKERKEEVSVEFPSTEADMENERVRKEMHDKWL